MIEGKKFDKGKEAVSLLPTHPIEEVTRVFMFGADKYGLHNWREGMKWSRLISAALRHLIKWNEGEEHDDESGLSHLAHAACNLLFLLEYEQTKREFDDRYNKEAKLAAEKILEKYTEEENEKLSEEKCS